MSLGGFEGLMIESDSIFGSGKSYILQIKDRITGWKNNGEWMSVDRVYQEIENIIAFNPSLVWRIVTTDTKTKVIDSNDKSIIHIALDQDTSAWGSI